MLSGSNNPVGPKQPVPLLGDQFAETGPPAAIRVISKFNNHFWDRSRQGRLGYSYSQRWLYSDGLFGIRGTRGIAGQRGGSR